MTRNYVITDQVFCSNAVQWRSKRAENVFVIYSDISVFLTMCYDLRGFNYHIIIVVLTTLVKYIFFMEK